MIKVVLTYAEMEMAAAIGIRRRIESMKKNMHKDRYLSDGMTNKNGHILLWDVDIEAAAAELAFCKYYNLFWEGTVNNFNDGDVEKKYEIRHTTRANGSLICRDHDVKTRKFVLVTGVTPNFVLVGWLLGTDAMKEKWLSNPNNGDPAYFIPQSALNKMPEK